MTLKYVWSLFTAESSQLDEAMITLRGRYCGGNVVEDPDAASHVDTPNDSVPTITRRKGARRSRTMFYETARNHHL